MQKLFIATFGYPRNRRYDFTSECRFSSVLAVVHLGSGTDVSGSSMQSPAPPLRAVSTQHGEYISALNAYRS